MPCSLQKSSRKSILLTDCRIVRVRYGKYGIGCKQNRFEAGILTEKQESAYPGLCDNLLDQNGVQSAFKKPADIRP